MSDYNLTGLKEMAQGNDDFVKNMINVFLEHTPPILEEMNESFKKGDLKKVGELAHQIKPSVDLMGIESVHEIIRDVEKKGKDNIIEGMNSNINKLNVVMSSVFATMGSEL